MPKTKKAKVKIKTSLKGGHTYANPNVTPVLVVDKEGKLVTRLKNLQKENIELANNFRLVSSDKLEKYREYSIDDIIDNPDFDEVVGFVTNYTKFGYAFINDLYYMLTVGQKETYLKKGSPSFHEYLMMSNIENVLYLNDFFVKVQPDFEKDLPIYRGIRLRSFRDVDLLPIQKAGSSSVIRNHYIKNKHAKLIESKVGDIIDLVELSPTSWTLRPEVAYDFTLDYDTKFRAYEERNKISRDKFNEYVKRFKEGYSHTFAGFLLKIEPDENMPDGYHIDLLSAYPEEEEVLLPPFISKFRINGIDYSEYKIEAGRYKRYVAVKEISLKPIIEPKYVIKFDDIR